MASKPLKIAFPLIGRGGWTGGNVYLKNTLSLISSRLADSLEAHVFLSPEENAKFGPELAPLADGRIICNPDIAVSGRGGKLLRSIVTGSDAKLLFALREKGVEAVFENASFYGARFGLPVVSWIPDFQHRHMPHMFSRSGWWRRDLGFKMQIASGRTIMLSSHSAQNDLETFYPKAQGKSEVVRFAANFDIAHYLGRADEMRAVYGLPEKYFFLPNQFWQHKNHSLVIEALAVLKQALQLQNIPPIAVTGQPNDPRSPNHFKNLMAKVNDAGLESHFRYLGLVPYDHVLALNASSQRMINPSFFEGWSTPIEEAKAFATPLALSDIPIHREQAPDALFYDPRSPEALAGVLKIAASQPPRRTLSVDTLESAQNERLNEHAASLLRTFRRAMNSPIS
jgi:glycosyltransferase involved in cell wall biosynthesis